MSAKLKAVYTAANEEAARAALEEFETSELGQKYPQSVKVWRDGWDKLIPFLQFPPAARKVIYTTNSIESRIVSCVKPLVTGSNFRRIPQLSRHCG